MDGWKNWVTDAICVIIGRVRIVEQIFSSKKRITTAIQVERGHYKFDLSSSSRIAYEITAALSRHAACMRPTWGLWYKYCWHDACKTAPCLLRPTMSPGCFSWCSLLMKALIPWKSKVTKTQTEVSNEYQIRWYNLLDNYLHQDLPENDPTIISTTKKCTTVEDPVTETNPKAAVSGFILTILHLSDTLLRTGTAWNWTSTDRLDNEGTYLCRGPPSYGDKFQCGGERIDSYPPISLTLIFHPGIVWKPHGGRSLNITVFHGRRERGLKGVAVCSSFHTGSTDTRSSGSRSKNHGSLRRAMRGL